MKKKLFTLTLAMCFSSAIFAQFSNEGKSASNSFFSTEKPENPWNFGIRAGLNMSSVSTSIPGTDADYTDDGFKSKVGFNLGLNIEYSIFKSLSIKSGIYITTKGAKYEYETSDTHRYSYHTEVEKCKYDGTLNEYYIQIPVLGSYKYYIKDNFNVEVNVGPYVAYGIAGKSNGKESWRYYLDGVDKTSSVGNGADMSNSYKYNTFGKDYGQEMLKRFDCGLIIGAGVTYNKYYFGLQYDLGMTNLLPSPYSSVYSGKNRNLGLNIGYNF